MRRADSPKSNRKPKQKPSVDTVSTGLAITRADLPWIAELIYKSRVDLHGKFDLETEQGLFEFVLWLLNSATGPNICLKEEPDFVEFCERKMMAGSNLNVLQTAIYLNSEVLQLRFKMPSAEQEYIQWFSETFRSEGEGTLAELARMHLGVLPKPIGFKSFMQNRDFKKLPFGVNVIGYVYGQLGIGEDARMTLKALQSLNIPCCAVNFVPGSSIPQNDYSMHRYVKELGPYSVNVFCMTATETARYLAFMGNTQFQDRVNIGYWPWELDKWPTNWIPINQLVDEVWVSSNHIAKALSPVCDKPVKVVPLHVDLGLISPLTRADFGLPPKAKLFVFSFDLHSSVHRKNPQECIQLFLESFPKGQPGCSAKDVGLVIKTHRPSRQSDEWDRIKALAESDERVIIIEQTLNRPDLLALYRCCDCFISLHRAEGYGRGIAEAIKLGLEVITTNYSGNVDFCRAPQCTLVDYELIDVEQGQYIEAKGMKWAKPINLPKLSAEVVV